MGLNFYTASSSLHVRIRGIGTTSDMHAITLQPDRLAGTTLYGNTLIGARVPGSSTWQPVLFSVQGAGPTDILVVRVRRGAVQTCAHIW
jgi:hypothetical protein